VLFGDVVVTILKMLNPHGNKQILLAVIPQLSAKEGHCAVFIGVLTAISFIAMCANGDHTVLDDLNMCATALLSASSGLGFARQI